MQKKGELSRLAVNLLIGSLIIILGVVIWIILRGGSGVEQQVFTDENIDLKISQVKKVNDNTLDLTLKRGEGEGEFIGLSFAVSDGSLTEVVRVNSSMPENQTGNFSLNFVSMNASRIKKVSVTPIYLNEEGVEVIGNVKDEYVTPNTCSNYCPVGAQCGYNDCGMQCGTGCSVGYLCLNYKCIKQKTSSGGGGGSGGSSGGDSTPTCTDTCSSLGYGCGTHSVCGVNVNCGTCSTGYTCSTNSTCIQNPANCTDTCSTFGYNCGIQNICNISTNCGNCSTGFICNLNGLCECNSTCSSLGYQCGTRTVCGNSVNCGTCSTGYTCQTNGTCTQNPCTDTCASLVKQCGIQTICGNSINCGTCSTGYTCSSGLCIPSCVPTTCAALARNCGTVSDGCGGTLTCGNYGGGCQTGYTCQVSNGTCMKDCVPTTCAALSRTCGTASNGCGGTLNCGTCQTGYTCQVNGTCIKDVVVDCGTISCKSGEYCSNGVCLMNVTGKTYFVATNGNDAGSGNFTNPWKTWQKAFNTANAGDIVYFRGGIWYPTESLIIAPRELPGEWGGPYYGNMGTAENPIRYFNYPGETPIIDGKNHISENYPSIMYFFGAAYVEFKGITVRNLPQQPTSWMAVGIGCSCCSNFKFENMIVHDIGGRGYSWFSCKGSYRITEDTNIWINSDTYNCKDPYSPEPGNGGDCFKTVNEAGAYSIFQGCRAWNCSDDGYDLSGPNTVIVNNSWSFLNGFPGALDGNGFKSGGVYTDVSSPTRIITNNIAANNTGYGYFDLEYDDLHRNNARVYNNLFYSSGTGILISDNPNYDRTLSIYRNNIVYIANNLDSTNRPYIIDAPFYYTESNNNWDMVDMGSSSWWDYADDVTVTDSDFLSLDVYQLMRSRKADGSLPDVTFGHLTQGSDLIDAGTQIPSGDNSGIVLSYSGSAPDIGPFESNY